MAKEQGYELSDEQLEAVSGGDWSCWSVCSKYDDVKDWQKEHCPAEGPCPFLEYM